MRDLLFRVFDKELGFMSEPFDFRDIAGRFGCVEFRGENSWYSLLWELIVDNPDRFIIMQSIGKQTYGNEKETEIFRDDIVRASNGVKDDPDDCYHESLYKVEWDEEVCGFFFVPLRNKTGYDEPMVYWQFYDAAEDTFDRIEVIGNVHEHKHLLEAADGN